MAGRMRASDLDPRRARRIVAVYLGAAGIWIVASGAAVDPVAGQLGVPANALEVAKGLSFVLFTAAVLNHALRRWAGRLQRAARAEREAAARMRHAEQMRSAFLSGVSHELRTPLTAIVGYAATIHERGEHLQPGQLEDLAGRLVVNSEHLRELVEDLLEVDRLVHGIGQVRAEVSEVSDLVHRVVDATDTGGRSVEVIGGSVSAVIDVAKVERLLQHLLDNAVRHTDPGTSIAVTVAAEGDGVSLQVEDDGGGLPDALIGRLFDPFVQDPAASQRASPGMGIGLTLVAQFAAMHHGTAVAENRPEGGARFTVRLPGGAAPSAPSLSVPAQHLG